MQPPTVREVISRLKSEGWVFVRQNGTSHAIYGRDGETIPISGKPGEHMDRGTYALIKRRLGW